MAVPGVWEEKELKLLLKKLLENKDESYKFAVAASGPKEGRLILDKKQKLKKKEVQEQAEAEARKDGGKAVKLDVMTGECRLDARNDATLRLIVYGKAPAKAVACVEHLLVKGPFKTVGFTGVILEEVEEVADDAPAPPTTGGGAAPGPSSDAKATWEKALADIEPAYLQGLRDRPDDASKLRAVLGFAQGKADKQDFAAAIAALQKLAEALRGKPSAGTSEGQTTPPATGGAAAGDPAALFTERLKALLPAIKAAAGTPPGDEAKLRASEAGVFVRKQDFAQANLLLDRVEAVLKPASPAAGAGGSGDPLAIWRDAKDAVDAQLNKLNAAMRQSPHPYLQRVAEVGLHGITNDPSRIFVNMQASLFDFAGSQGADRQKAAARVREACRNYRQFVENSKLLEVCDTKGICGPMMIRKTLLDALSEVDRLAAAIVS